MTTANPTALPPILSLPAKTSLATALASALETQQIGICVCDPEDRIVQWNPTFKQLFPETGEILRPGVPYRDCLRRFFEVNLTDHELANLEQHVEAALQRRHNIHEPYLYRRINGSWLKMEWRATDDGGLITLVRDVTSEPHLSKTRELQAAFSNIDIGFALFTPEAALISANRRYFDLFPDCAKLKRSRASYRGHLECIADTGLDDPDRDRLMELAQRDMNTISNSAEPLIVRRNGGGWLALEQRRTESGGLMCLWNDVSEQVHTQHQLSTLQNRLTDAIESIPDAFALFDNDDCLVISNQRYQEVSGIRPRALMPGAPWSQLIQESLAHGQFAAAKGREEAWLAERQQQRHNAANSQEIRLSDGRWVRAQDRRTRDGGTVSVATDITDLKHREAELSRQATMLNAISYATASLLGHASWENVVDNLLARLGQAAAVDRVMVFKINQIETQTLTQSCRFEWLADGVDSVKQSPHNQFDLIVEVDPTQASWIQRRRRGEVIQAKVKDLAGLLRRIFDEDGARSVISIPIMVDGSWWGHINFYDCRQERVWPEIEIDVLKTAALLLTAIVERSQMDAELRHSEQRFRSIAEALPVIITKQDEGEILYASPAIGILLGLPSSELIGRSIKDFYAYPGERERLLQEIERKGYLDDIEITYRGADGSLLPATLTSRRVTYDGHSALINAVTDLTARKVAEAEIARQRDALHQADKMSALGSLLAGVAHELNNPLSVLVGQALLLEEESQNDPDRSKRAVTIRTAAERSGRIVKTFLAMARQRPVEYREVYLQPLITNILDLIGYGIRSNAIQVKCECPATLPPVYADPDQLSQLLLNLIINAQHALLDRTEDRQLRLSMHYQAKQLILEVADNGPGIADDIKQRIFDPFFTTKPVGVGTGIGLSLCSSIVDSFGGTIEVSDADEGGALFRVRLPITQAQQRPPEPLNHDTAQDQPGKHVLVVDDELEIAEMLAEILSGAGYRPMIASSGREALECAAKQHFDLILSDVRMPDLDGLGLYRALEDIDQRLSERLIFITGDILSNPDLATLKQPIPTVEKPFDPDEIRRVVAARLAELAVKRS